MLKVIYKMNNDIELYMNPQGSIDQRMYVMRKESHIIVIDPNICEDLLAYINKWGCSDVLIMLTHEHYDHITGVNWLLNYCNCRILCSRKCYRAIESPVIGAQMYCDIMIPEEEREYYRSNNLMKEEGYQFPSDILYEKYLSFRWFNNNTVECFEAPGHSPGGTIYLINKKYVFSGDNLLNDDKILTRFPGGKRRDYMDITRPILESFDRESIVFPGHGDYNTLLRMLKR